MNRMSWVSTTTKSCLFQCWVTLSGTKLSRPSRILSRLCCTPSPPMSREPAPVRAPCDRRAILSISSMKTMPRWASSTSCSARCKQLADHHLDVLAVVASLGVLGRVGDHERHLQAAGQRARDMGLARAGRSDQQQVRLLDEALLPRRLLRAALEVIVGGDGDGPLRAILPDDVPVQIVEDLARRGNRGRAALDAGIGFHSCGVSHRTGGSARFTPRSAGSKPVGRGPCGVRHL